jgi:hypothetical protein
MNPVTQTIKAQVSANILKKSQFLFNQSTNSYLGELLQNSRRAGATKVDITLAPSGEDTRITIIDNGGGIKDPQDLVHLGNSNWSEETEIGENPAGMGFFSLCHLKEGVCVSSNDWEVTIDSEVFSGKKEAEVIHLPKTNNGKIDGNAGTKLSFVVNKQLHEIEECFKDLLQFYPVTATINGKPVTQVDFLKKCVYVREIPGGRIGVCGSRSHRYAWVREEGTGINFHGINLSYDLVEDLPFDVRVDVKENKLLDLVLPNRKAVVENRKLEDIKTACRAAVYMYLAQNKVEHKLPYKNYKEAHDLGINLHEAKASLSIKTPRDIQNTYGWSGPTKQNYQPKTNEAKEKMESVTPNSIVTSLDAGDIAALHFTTGEIPLLHCHTPEMEGYSWYPQRRATSVSQIITTLPVTKSKDNPSAKTKTKSGKENKTSPSPSPSASKGTQVLTLSTEGWTDEEVNMIFGKDRRNQPPFVKDIAVELVICGPSSCNVETLRFPSIIAFDTYQCGEEGVDGSWVTIKPKEHSNKKSSNKKSPKKAKGSKKSEGVTDGTQETHRQIDAYDLRALFFSPCQDGDCDSYDTQADNFNDYAEDALLRVYSSEEEANEEAVRRALNQWEVRTAIRNLGHKSFEVIMKSGEVTPIFHNKSPRKKSK